MKGKFKNSKLFNTIKRVAPEVIDTVTDIAEESGMPFGKTINTIVDKAMSKATKPEDIAEIRAAQEEYIRDTQDARQMYRDNSKDKSDQIANSVIKWNLLIIMGLVVVDILAIWKLEGTVATVVSSIISLAIGNLFQERNTVIGFFFGSSQGSKDKDSK